MKLEKLSNRETQGYFCHVIPIDLLQFSRGICYFLPSSDRFYNQSLRRIKIRNENKHLSFGAIRFQSRQMVKCRFLSLIFQIFWGSLAVWERLRGLRTIIFGCQRRVHEPSTGANTLNQPIRGQVDLVSGTYLAPHSTAQFVNRPCQATSCAFLPWQW